MLRINCPCCGPRDEEEFTFGGPWPHPRPDAPDTLTDAEWADYLFTRENTRGRTTERWRHTFGCRQWLVCERDNVTHQIFSVRPINDIP